MIQKSIKSSFKTQITSDSQQLLNQKVKIMDSSLSFGLELTFQDVMKNLNCSKEQIARRFRLLIQQKQSQLRKQISDVNTSNLKILQQKSLYFQEVSRTNRTLNEELLNRNEEIQVLNKKLKQQSENVKELQHKLVQEEKKFKNFQEHTLTDYKRLQVIEIKYKTLMRQIQDQKNRKNQLQRKVDKMKNENINWGDRINYLMINRQNGLKEEYDEEIQKLKDILYFYEHNNKILKQELAKEKETFNEVKESYELAIHKIEAKYGLSKVPYFHHVKVQTEENTIKKIDVACEIKVECINCQKINNIAKHLDRKSVHVQTLKDPRKFADNEAQTYHKFMQKDQEKSLINQIKQALQINQRQKQIYEAKLAEVYNIFENQPSKMDDLKAIGKLQTKNSEKQREISMLKQQISTLKNLNSILHFELQSLKSQIQDATEVRIDSLQFKKKNTARLFTEEILENESKTIDDGFFDSKKLINEKKFSKTVTLTTNRMNYNSCKKRTIMTPQLKRPPTSKQKMNNTFYTNDPQTFRWEKIEKKLKNPEFFSPSPYVNAVRRQKYRKFSSVKKKKYGNEQNINFTIAF